MKKLNLLLTCTCALFALSVQGQKQLLLSSPDGKLKSTITVGDKLTYDISCNGQQVLAPSPISATLDNGKVWGDKARLSKVTEKKNDTQIDAPFYRSSCVRDYYNELTLRFKGDYSVVFRAYNDGVAYRFVNHAKKPFCILNEEVDYRFPADVTASVPYVNAGKDGDYNGQFHNSFENVYTTAPISQLNKERLMFLPLVVQATPEVKICITETDLNNYPGLYLTNAKGSNSLSGIQAPYPKTMKQGGHNNLQMRVQTREEYIAKVDGPRNFPWRVAVVTTRDTQLAASNLSYLLAEPSKLSDTSWIKPGKVAWEWWNDWNLCGVDFKTGVNNATYKAYIDFASQYGIEYVILDEGWAVNLKADLMQVVKEIDLKELVDYAAARNVGIILWAGYYAFERDMENVCRYFSEMGVKGFKVDFMDRDDQLMTDFNHRAAAMCAKYHLILDLHGTHKPAGLNRTYPNVLNFEGVHGLEQMKWRPAGFDQITYDVMIPFIRQVAGPMDYTQGAMRNATRENYYPSNSEPMSQGTRCHQLAMYIVLESPFNMLCDSPSNYMREPESTSFIAQVPTVWDETVVLDGKMGEYIITARRKGDTWFVGGLNNWDARDVEVDLSFLSSGSHKAVLFKDGVNAHRTARDYKREEVSVSSAQPLKVHLAPGGGFTLQID
ncbi:glycoside hydrolase family 97 protein [Phocaeicola coprophilus]|uniref:glycoside hydrolase family 97 protein n=1 Tax=Phocaeicola coprophilus TaxID=387090 RepID=UPI0040274BBA